MIAIRVSVDFLRNTHVILHDNGHMCVRDKLIYLLGKGAMTKPITRCKNCVFVTKHVCIGNVPWQVLQLDHDLGYFFKFVPEDDIVNP